jgi:CBS domain containing-hemolysin-like protein
MDGDNFWNVILLLILIVLSGYFSSSETAFTSSSQVRLKNEADKGNKKAERTLKLVKNFESVLSTILIGNNIVNIVMTALATLLFVEWFPNYGSTLSTIVMTIIVLIFGEVTPKSIAKEKSESLAKFSAPIIQLLMIIFKPAILFFEKWKTMLNKLFHLSGEETISEDELLSLVDEASMAGSLEDHEHQLVRSAIEFDDLEVSSILTPRVDIVGFSINENDDAIENLFETHNFSRLIVYENSIDQIIGELHEKDFNRYLKTKKQTNRKLSPLTVVKDIIYVPPTINLSKLLRLMQANKTHIVVVSDEHGGTIGIVTMEDVLEELVGEIWDESDTIEQKIKEIQEGNVYYIKGTANVEKTFETLGIDCKESHVSTTISGFVSEQLERVAKEGDIISKNQYTILVRKVEKRRVIEIEMKIH